MSLKSRRINQKSKVRDVTVFPLSGTPALTSRQFKENDFIKVVEFIDVGIEIALDAQKKTGLLILNQF